MEHDAQQCGFCTPGFVVAAKAFLDRHPNPTREQIEQVWAAICADAARMSASVPLSSAGLRRKEGAMPEYKWPDANDRDLIGKRITRLDGPVKSPARRNTPTTSIGRACSSPGRCDIRTPTRRSRSSTSRPRKNAGSESRSRHPGRGNGDPVGSGRNRRRCGDERRRRRRRRARDQSRVRSPSAFL